MATIVDVIVPESVLDDKITTSVQPALLPLSPSGRRLLATQILELPKAVKNSSVSFCSTEGEY